MRVVVAKKGASGPGVSNAGMRCDTTCLRSREEGKGAKVKMERRIGLSDERQDNAPVHAKREVDPK